MQTCKPNPRNETMRFEEMNLSHTKEFEIRHNIFVIIRHNMNVFIILKAHFVKKTAPDSPFDCSMDFLKNVRKVVTPIRKAISLDLSLDKYLDQIFWFYTFRTDVSNRFNNWKQFFIKKCIIKYTNNYRADCLQLQKKRSKNMKTQSKSCP